MAGSRGVATLRQSGRAPQLSPSWNRVLRKRRGFSILVIAVAENRQVPSNACGTWVALAAAPEQLPPEASLPPLKEILRGPTTILHPCLPGALGHDACRARRRLWRQPHLTVQYVHDSDRRG